MKMKWEKKNIMLVVIVIAILIAITVGTILCLLGKKDKTPMSGEKPNLTPTPTLEVRDQILNHTPTKDMIEQAPLIDMNNTENIKIQNGEKVNASEDMKKDRELSGLKITNIVLHTESGLSTFNATVENTTEEDFERKIVSLIFKKSDGSTLATVEAIIPNIKAKGSNTINASTTKDITNAKDVEIELR